MGERGFTKPCKNYCKQFVVFFLNFLNSFVHDCRLVQQPNGVRVPLATGAFIGYKIFGIFRMQWTMLELGSYTE